MIWADSSLQDTIGEIGQAFNLISPGGLDCSIHFPGVQSFSAWTAYVDVK